jgi:methylated-DNA-[protein]-cysteine S-methyltransferase
MPQSITAIGFANIPPAIGLYQTWFTSPAGVIVLSACESYLRTLDIRKNEPQGIQRQKNSVLEAARIQLEEYWKQQREEFDLPLAPAGTEFQRLVWGGLMKIPFGETATYGDLAQLIGKPGGQRAVGGALNRNPIPLIIPCHRILASNGLGGFGGGLPLKRALLRQEKASFID